MVLLMVANGAPILARFVLADRWNQPVDAHHHCADSQPLFGASKTWRGIFSALLCTSCAALILGLTASSGLLIAAAAMSGDVLSSFTKRRLRLPPSSMALGLDQIPESLLPLIAIHNHFDLEWLDIAQLTLAFIALELMLSRILYYLHIRKQPF